MFLLIPVSQASTLEELKGTWKSVQKENFAGGWRQRVFQMNQNTYVYTSLRFDSQSAAEPYLEQKIEGTVVSARSNPSNARVTDLELTITKNMATLKKPVSAASSLRAQNCLKPGEPANITVSGCGVFQEQKSAKGLFVSLSLQDKSTMMMGIFQPFPKSESLRTRALSIYPLVK